MTKDSRCLRRQVSEVVVSRLRFFWFLWDKQRVAGVLGSSCGSLVRRQAMLFDTRDRVVCLPVGFLSWGKQQGMGMSIGSCPEKIQ